MKTVGIVGCSNPPKAEWKESLETLVRILENEGNRVIVSNEIYENENSYTDGGKTRAAELMRLYENPDVTDIYDISGGDMANEILDFLDYEIIKKSNATFWGYSDLTTIINAIYTKTGKSSVLYSVKNLLYADYGEIQKDRFHKQTTLFTPSFCMVQGDSMAGTVIGGNIRCFLKLVGTPYFPDATNKILLLESCSGLIPQIITYLSQLRSCGVFEKIKGILLGTFTEMEEKNAKPNVLNLVQSFVGNTLPIAMTKEIGHGHDSKAIYIGKEIKITT